MTLPIWLQVRKATLIPAKTEWKRQRGDQVIAFKQLVILSYDDSRKLFKVLGGQLETDLEFAQMLHDNYGPGIYLIIAGGRGHSSFWNFLFLEIRADGSVFRRKPQSKTMKNRRGEIVQKILVFDTSDREGIKNDMEAHPDMYADWNKVKYGANYVERKKKRFGPYPYLKSVLRYDRSVEDVNIHKSDEEGGMDAIW